MSANKSASPQSTAAQGNCNQPEVSAAERARKLVEELDFACRIGEENWEIGGQVQRVGREIGAMFAEHLEKNPPSFLPQGIQAVAVPKKRGKKRRDEAAEHREFFGLHVEMLFNFIYLFQNNRQRSITRYSERLLEQLLIESCHELGYLELLKESLFYSIFEEAFTFLELLGIPVRAKIRIQQLRKIFNRMQHSQLEQFALN